MQAKVISWVIKPVVFFCALIPLGCLVWDATQDNLGADPAKAVVKILGLWAIRFLWLTLAITPLRLMTKQAWVLRLRRMLGLFALFYASLHFLSYLALLLQWQWASLGDDIAKRPYVMVGFAAFVLLLPLGLTSFNYAIKMLGKRWQQLHQLVYVIALLVITHFFWLARSDITQQIIYALILFGLLAIRGYFTLIKTRAM